MPKLLLFSYFYPPLGGPAVQRPLKLIKYLVAQNWQVDVISKDDVYYHSRDKELAREDRAEKVIRVSSGEPMALLNRIESKHQGWGSAVYFRTPEFLKSLVRRSYFIDDKHAWLKPAVATALDLCRENRYEAVMATMGPFTAGVAAYKVSRYLKIPLIIDYRDHWNLNPYISYLTCIHRWLARSWEKRLLRTASLITVVGEKMGEELVQSFRIHPTRLQVMYNGWDEDDFRDLQSGPTTGGNRVFSYIGNFYGQRTPRYFLLAIQELWQEKKLPDKLKLLFVGNYYRETQ
ncbi:MAG: glycosyltransferase, partial [Candidatus Cloacimonetes bacterium]|nr:glycosyltransferase [Candidatus Cloacimonadota bacterium]